MLALLAAYEPSILAFHLIGVALGVGGATIADMLFFRFLRDKEITEGEARVLRRLSRIITWALVLLFVTGIGLYLPAMERLNASPAFLSKAAIICVITLNGVLLHLFVSPRLVDLSFQHGGIPVRDGAVRLRTLAFSLGAVSMISWYSVLLIATLKRAFPAGTTVTHILSLYAAALVVAIVTSQVVRIRLERSL